MKWSDIICETDHPQPYTWVKQTDRMHLAAFQIGDIEYWVKAYLTRSRILADVEDIWVLGFGIDPETSKRLFGHQYGIMKPTGLKQHASTILKTVAAVLDDFIQEQRPQIIWMSDTDSVQGRSRLYTRYAQHLVDKFGYHYDTPIMKHFDGQPIWCLRS